MPTSRAMAARLRKCLAAPRPADADLLARFVATRDDDAFAELVRRHGPTILAVCRRIVGNRHAADDAFQVTFLVLARKADRVRPAPALGGWLYGVAVRAARKALARTGRRRDREAPIGELPDVPRPAPADHDPDAARVVLEAALADKLAKGASLSAEEVEAEMFLIVARADRSGADRGFGEREPPDRLAAGRSRLALNSPRSGVPTGVGRWYNPVV